MKKIIVKHIQFKERKIGFDELSEDQIYILDKPLISEAFKLLLSNDSDLEDLDIGFTKNIG